MAIGTALVRTHFPKWKYDDEAYYLSCLFHDIGTADRYLATTKMSFEFKGAIVAREFILEHGGAEDLADGVCEVILYLSHTQCMFMLGGRLLFAIRMFS
jgi:cyanamide hydratase